MVRNVRFNGAQMVIDMMMKHTKKEVARASGGGLVMLVAVRHEFPTGWYTNQRNEG